MEHRRVTDFKIDEKKYCFKFTILRFKVHSRRVNYHKWLVDCVHIQIPSLL